MPVQVWVRLIAGALAAAGAIVTWKRTANKRSDLNAELADKRAKWGESLADKRAEWGSNFSDKRATWGTNFADKLSEFGHRINEAFERTFNIDDADSELGWEVLETVMRSTVSPAKGSASDIAHVIADYKALGDGRGGRHRA